jgi:alpha-glucosidase
MTRRFKFLLHTFLLTVCSVALAAESETLLSPDKQVEANIHLSDEGACLLDVKFHGNSVLVDSPLGLTLSRGRVLGADTKFADVTRRTENSTWKPLWGKRATVVNHFNEMTIACDSKGLPGVSIVARAYDNGVAIRYALDREWGQFEVIRDETGFQFSDNITVWAVNYDGKGFRSSQESEFLPMPVSELDPTQIYGCPLLAKVAPNVWAAISDANLTDWAGMHFQRDKKNPQAVKAVLAPRYDDEKVAVRSEAPRNSPWRMIMLGATPGELVESDLVRNLNDPPKGDFSWVKPGKSVWDRWWSDSYAPEVDFKVGVNTETMKYFVDLAPEVGAAYQLVDDGWAKSQPRKNSSGPRKPADITQTSADIEIPALVEYANSKGVGILLWLQWQSVRDQMDEAFPLFEKWGIKGVKIDFMDRDDQEMVNFYHRVAQKAAEHHLTVDFHGAYKPTGDSRTWPNLITREGVMGNEYNKWSTRATPEHTVTIPFTRGLFGEMDFTPGGFRNKTEKAFRLSNTAPFVMGTRVRQLAMLVVYESALQVLCDSPYNYRSSPAGMDFLKVVPTTWHDTRVIHGEVGDFITIARRHGDDWYLGSMTDGTARTLEIPLKFLGDGKYRAEIWADAYEADEFPDRLMKSKQEVTSSDTLSARMAPGGAHVVRLMPK